MLADTYKKATFHPQSVRRGLYRNGGKRCLDIMLVLALSPLWVPLTVILLGVSWLDTGRGFYTEMRVGRGGRLFTCWKLRTLPEMTQRRCASQKSETPSTASPIGQFLRRSSLDELPQFWCVLIGDMSLVGPRPVPKSELALYGPARSAYLAVRPGLTGIWQVSGRNAVGYDTRVALDRTYITQMTVLSDVRCLAATLREVWVLSGR